MPRELPSQQQLRELLDYDPSTGDLRWRVRPGHPAFNTRKAGQLAFTSSTSRGYRQGDIFGVNFLAHRVIWKWVTGEDPDTIDHINRNKTDNRWDNLRSVTNLENMLNTGLAENSSSGITGVFFSATKRGKQWGAHIKVGRRNRNLGYYHTMAEAAQARHEAELRFGFPQSIPPKTQHAEVRT